MGDLGVLLIENQKIPGALRGAVCHEIQEPFHRFVIPEHLLGLSVHPRPQFFTLCLFQGSIIFFGQPGFFRLHLSFAEKF